MKRSLICLILAAVLCGGGLTAAAVAINSARDQVYYTETIHLGDVSMAEGITVTSEIQMMWQLFWEVEHRLGKEPDTETEYEYFTVPQNPPRRRESVGIWLSNNVADDLDIYADISQLTGVRRVMRELYEELEPGESVEKRIRLADYYDYYPIGMTIQLSDGSYLGGWSGEYYNDSDVPPEELPDEEKARRAFQEFFKIPVPESHRYDITIEVGNGNRQYGYMAGNILETDEDDYFEMNTRSVLTEDTCYFTFGTRTIRGEIVDTSHIPGGYGIYSFGYEPEGAKIFSGDGSDLAMVYPLEPEVRVEGLYTAREGKKLILLTQEPGNLAFVTVIDTATMETLERFEITRGAEGEDVGVHTCLVYEDFLALYTYNNKLAVVDWKDGEYRLAFVAQTNPNPEETKVVGLPYYPVMAWDGEKLAACGVLFSQGLKYGSSSCGFKLTVYDETGMIFCGDYNCSLHTENSHRADCQVVGDRYGQTVGLSIQWDDD